MFVSSLRELKGAMRWRGEWIALYTIIVDNVAFYFSVKKRRFPDGTSVGPLHLFYHLAQILTGFIIGV